MSLATTNPSLPLNGLEATVFLELPKEWQKSVQKAKSLKDLVEMTKEILKTQMRKQLSKVSVPNPKELSLWELHQIFQMSQLLPSVPIQEIADQVVSQWKDANVLDSIERSIRTDYKDSSNSISKSLIIRELSHLMSIPSGEIIQFAMGIQDSSLLERIFKDLSKKIHDTGSLQVAKEYFMKEIYRSKALFNFKKASLSSNRGKGENSDQEHSQVTVKKFISLVNSLWFNKELFSPLAKLMKSPELVHSISDFIIKRMNSSKENKEILNLNDLVWETFSWIRGMLIGKISEKRYGHEGICSIDYNLYDIEDLYEINKKLSKSSRIDPCKIFQSFPIKSNLSIKSKICHGLLESSAGRGNSSFFLEKFDSSLRSHVESLGQSDQIDTLKEYCLNQETLSNPTMEVMYAVNQKQIREETERILNGKGDSSLLSSKDRLFNLWNMARRFNSPLDAATLGHIRRASVISDNITKNLVKGKKLPRYDFDLKQAIIEASQNDKGQEKDKGKKDRKRKHETHSVTNKHTHSPALKKPAIREIQEH